MINLTLQNTKTYASVSNLEKALVRYNLKQFQPIIVGIPETDKLTAIFQFSKVGNNYVSICNKGFVVLYEKELELLTRDCNQK